MKPYVPQPGTIPHKVIEHLKTLPPDAELSTSALAEVVGQPRSSMAACMNTPRNHGALKSRRCTQTGAFFWSLGDGTPPPKPDDHEQDKPLNPVPKVPTKPASPFDLRQPRPVKPRPDAPEPDRQTPLVIQLSEPEPAAPVPVPVPNRAKFGVYSDNTFCIQRGTDAIWLEPEEFQELAEFIAKTHTQ